MTDHPILCSTSTYVIHITYVLSSVLTLLTAPCTGMGLNADTLIGSHGKTANESDVSHTWLYIAHAVIAAQYGHEGAIRGMAENLTFSLNSSLAAGFFHQAGP